MAKTQIKNYVFKPGIGALDNLYPNAYSLLEDNKSFIQKEATAWIQSQVDADEPGFAGYTYNQEKCERDIGYIIDAYLYDLRYGGNSKTYKYSSYYWDQDVAQVDGDRQPEIQTHTFIRDLITDYIFTNTLYTAENISETQVTSNTQGEVAAEARIDTLSQIVIDVITNGLSSLPTLEPTGVGTIKIQGRYDSDQLLLITNTAKNEIVYSFNTNSTGGSVEQKTDSVEEDSNFAKYLQTTDAITTITLNYNTSNHSATDDLQIFVEATENGKSITTTRPFDFGTDAIERMRVAQPLSMLDADFEYGLQPTKWAAISTMRGYPSVYEIPGTDTPVQSVITDASAGTDGIGQSLITVTTVGPHGFTEGTPITIKALEDGVIGAARAEGSFVIVTVPENNKFTYYAKSKVGDTQGAVLSTTYTQLRQAGFYTGANIGQPDITVSSNGSAGTLTTELAVESGSTVIPYDGTSPEIGAPLTGNANIPTGSQITSVIDLSSGGGTYITPAVSENIANGVSEVTVVEPAGIVQGLAVDRGDGFSSVVIGIDGNTIEFDSPFVGPITGNVVSFTNVQGYNDESNGVDATFTISASGTTYTVDSITDPGSGYKVGDRILIPGTELSGQSPDNDAVIIIDTIASAGEIGTVTIDGTAFDGNATVDGVSGNYDFGLGSGVNFDITWEDNVYNTVDVSSPDNSLDYKVNDVIRIPGDLIDPINGASPLHDLYVTITSVTVDGSITGITFEGTAPDYSNTFPQAPYTTDGAGTGIEINVTLDAASYSVEFILDGQDFLPGDTITVLGTDLDGASPDNDCTITVDNVGGLGEVVSASVAGVAFNGSSAEVVAGENLQGSGATFDVEISGGSYVVTLATPGTEYATNQEIVIPGTSLLGESPLNDLTITIVSVDDITTGVITAITSAGTAISGGGVFTDLSGSIQPNVGSGALFDVDKDFDIYTNITASAAGSNYQVGNRIIVPGTDLGGIEPLNDVLVRVTGVDAGTGAIQTITSEWEQAEYGVNFDLISTVSITEATTGDIAKGETADFEELASLLVSFDSAHGLVPGDTFIVDIGSDDGINNHGLASGSFFVTSIPEVDELTYQARAAGPIEEDGGNDPIQGTIYPRPDSFFIHRPFDGGVQLGTGGPQHGAQAIRQSKKYIRYQSGKGIMYTTGALFAPSYDLRSVIADGVEVGSEITITTDDNDHGLQVGGTVRLLGIETPGYNSGPETAVPPEFDYEVIEIVDERTYKVRAQRRLGSTDAVLGFGSQMSVVSWHGATVRSGIFDDQNGIFWEFDGTQISVVQRTGTRQLAGSISLAVDDNLVTGNNTRFRDQLKAGDRIIIKGMTHVVSHVNSQTEITVTPDWRGIVDITGAKANLIVDKKTKQSDFNLDRLDGTGPSGYDIDIAKMQMIGIQYSWYGAGFIDFMLRGADGNFVFAHRMRNSNVNTEAFMRSGNLPVRYEVSNEGPSGKLLQDMNETQDYIELVDTSFFPTSGYVYIDNEIISFSGKDDSSNRLTGCARSATFINFQAGASRSYTAGLAAQHTARTGVVLISQTITPLISHWGSAFITDGLFDEDRGYIFSYAETGLTVSTTKQTAFLIRLAPSVSNALVGDLGERELLNRAQLLLQGLEITSDTGAGGIVIEGILNPQNYPLNPNDIGWSGLSGLAQGGQPSFAQVASGGSVVWSTGDTATTATATAQATMSETITSGIYTSPNNRNYVFINVADYNTTFNGQNIIGKTITGSNIRNNTTITNVYTSGTYGYFRLSQNTSGQVASNTPDAFTILEGGDLDNRNFALFDKTSFEASGARIGTAVTSGGSVTFPANTLVNSVSLKTFGATEYYEVQFNNAFSGTLAQNTGTIEFTFEQPPYAQPGETVFSFIATPGERSTLDLSELKELTNTPLGGRGTYPNGPDVLAINVYKVTGAEVDSNIIIRWGEAQA